MNLWTIPPSSYPSKYPYFIVKSFLSNFCWWVGAMYRLLNKSCLERKLERIMKQYKLVGWHSNVHLHGHTKRFGKLGIEFPVTVEVDGSVDEPFVAINGMTLLLYWFVWEPVG